MAQVYGSGPVSVWIKGAFDSSPTFMGHGERAPQPDFDPHIEPVICDVSGKAPLDGIYAGESAQINFKLIRYNRAVVDAVRVRARGALFPAAVPGIDAPGQLGSLLISEGCYYTLYLLFGSGLKPTMNSGANGAMGSGFRFYACVLGRESHNLGSVTAYGIQMTWTAYRIPDFTVQNTFGFGAFGLYDQVMGEVIGASMN